MFSTSGFDAATLARFADLLVGFGANVQPGQIVAVSGELGKEEVVRALAASAYRHGAKFVDATYFDMHVKRAAAAARRRRDARLRPVVVRRADARARRPALRPHRAERADRPRPARRHRPRASGPRPLPVDQGERPGRQRAHDELERSARARARRGRGSSIRSSTTHAGAGEARRGAGPRLRLDEEDPVGAWRARADALVGTAERITARRFDALHFEGPGTDLVVGLLPTSRFMAARFETIDGIVHMPNIPSEEVFTTPDPARTEGVVRSTKPLVVGGSIIRGPRGRVPRRARGAHRRRARTPTCCAATPPRTRAPPDSARSPSSTARGGSAATGTTFFDTLLDENAASHIALGSAYAFCLDGEHDRPAHQRERRSTSTS